VLRYRLGVESNLQISVRGLQDDVGRNVGEVLGTVIKALEQGEHALDFRRMHRIVVDTDFGRALAELSTSTASGRPIEHTNEEYAIAVAKVVLLPRGDGIEIVPVFNAAMVVPLTEDPNSEAFGQILHMVHHEFCHVHDDNKKLDALAGIFLRHNYNGKDKFLGPLAEVCWSEYAANRLSSRTAKPPSIDAMTGLLRDAIPRTKKDLNREIFLYRYHGNLDEFLVVFQRHGEFLVKSAAYVLGYMDGLNLPLEKLSSEAAAALSDSYFEPTWTAIQTALRNMWDIYPAGWHDLTVFNELSTALEQYYEEMGIVLTSMEDGGTYVDIPARPETMPGFGFC